MPVRARSVDVLEGAVHTARWAFRADAQALHAARVDYDDFARLDVAQQLRADYVERAGFEGRVVRSVAFAEDERLEAVRVARRVESVFKQDRYRVGAFEPFERVYYRVDWLHVRLLRDHMEYGLRVCRRLEYRAARFELRLEFVQVRNKAVVGYRYRAARVVRADGQDVVHLRAFARDVADVADRAVRVFEREFMLVYRVVEKPEAARRGCVAVVRHAMPADSCPRCWSGVEAEIDFFEYWWFLTLYAPKMPLILRYADILLQIST